MDSSILYQKIEEKIAICEKNCEKDRDDSFWSTVRNSERETLCALYERLKKSESEEKALAEFKRKLPVLEKAKEDEVDHPTFYWYDEHHHYKVLEGQCDAYRTVIKLLEVEMETA